MNYETTLRKRKDKEWIKICTFVHCILSNGNSEISVQGWS